MVTVERPKPVLSVEERHVESGRRTTNGYVILPDGFGEGAKSAGEEGAKSAGVITLKNIHKEVDTPIVPKRTKRDVQLPKDDDPALLLFMSFRRARGWSNEFSAGEWQGVHLLLREMVRADVTADDVYQRTCNLLGQWKTESMVTLRAVWKHWTSAGTSKATLPSAMRKVKDISDTASMALRFVQGRD
jgi:hypothetical protein